MKLLKFTSVITIIAGIAMICGGIGGAIYISHQVAREQIITPKDASIPSEQVKGPLTLKAQADIIRHHTLTTTDGKTYAEMPQGNPELDARRNIWITATTLTTALNLGLLSYAFSGLAIVLGILFLFMGLSFYSLSKKYYKVL